VPFIPVNLNDAKEAKPVPAGKYDLTILSCDEVLTREKQKPQYKIGISINGHDDAPPLNHFVGLPAEGDEPRATEFKQLLLKRFLVLFGLKVGNDGFDTTELAMQMVGATSRGEVGLSEPDDAGTVYNRLVVPKLRDEGNSGQAVTRSAPKPPKS
jgi:hypothetical protein